MTLVLLLAFAVLPSAQAWSVRETESGHEVHWGVEEPVEYYLNPAFAPGFSTDDVEDAVVGAAEEWESTGAGVLLDYMGFTSSVADPYDQTCVVAFVTDWEGESSQVGLTTLLTESTGQVVDADIEVNLDGIEWSLDGSSDAYDLQNMLVHEFGHLLGMAHSEEDELATMWPSATKGETMKRDLRPDDEEGLLYLYGQAASPTGPAICGVSANAHSRVGWLGLVGLAFAAIASRRSR